MLNFCSINAGERNISERFDAISSMISENFEAPWTAEPIGDVHRPASLNWAQADGVRFCHAEMSPLRLFNRARSTTKSSHYYVYTADQPSRVRLQSGSVIQLQPYDFLIHDADSPLEWNVHCNYVTRSLLIEKSLFQEYFPENSPIVGRRLSFSYGVERVLSEMMDAGWAVTRAGHFEQAGPKLVRAFLDVLSMMPGQDDADSVIIQNSSNALQIRRLQVKAFIDKNFCQADLSVTSIAERLRLSPRYIQKAFATDDITPSEYLRKRRLAASAQLLSNRAKIGLSITEIALSCGFNSSAYFSTDFLRAYGMSPRKYRASHMDTLST